MLSYSSISTVYDFPSYHRHHDRSNTWVYACCYLHTPSTRFTRLAGMKSSFATSWLAARCDKKSRQTVKHRRDGRIAQLTAEELIGLRGCGRFHSHVSCCHAEKERRPPLPTSVPLLRQDRLLQVLVREWCWTREEVRGRRHPCRMGLWEAGRVEINSKHAFF